MVPSMELDELLDREGLDPDELMIWAHRRAERLLADLAGSADGSVDGSGELARLLEPAGQIDLDGIPVRRVAVVDDMLPVSAGAAARVEVEVEETITQPIALPVVHDEPSETVTVTETDAAELGTRGRRRVPSTPQPLSASELPPPPEHPRLADGEPEPMLETVDTGPIDLGSAEARAMIAANSTRMPEPAVTRQEITQVAPAPTASSEVEATDASEEFEIDELEELDDEELELLVDVDDSGDDAEVAPPPPPRPPPSKPAQPAAAAPPPAKPIDNHVDMDDLIAGLADSE
jgi:hypothetical protein